MAKVVGLYPDPGIRESTALILLHISLALGKFNLFSVYIEIAF
jgi:hypothetical protein